MIIEQIKKIVPKEIKHFEKLNRGKDLYKFTDWGDDNLKFYYEFNSKDGTKKNVKRVFVKEIEALLKGRKVNDVIYRTDFETHCINTNRDGGCGFCVIIRILEFLKIGVYISYGKGFKITKL